MRRACWGPSSRCWPAGEGERGGPAALRNLAYGSEARKAAVSEAGAAPPLVALLVSGKAGTKGKAAGAWPAR